MDRAGGGAHRGAAWAGVMVAAVTAVQVATMASLIRRMVTPYVLALFYGLNWDFVS